MEFLSATANVIAVVGFACESGKFLIDFFRAVSGAYTDIQHQVNILQALCSVFASIKDLGPHLPVEHTWTSDFQDRLARCRRDLHLAERKLQKLRSNLGKGGLKKTLASIKWTIREPRWKEFFARIQMYHDIFSLELHLLHIKLHLSPSLNITRASSAVPNIIGPPPFSVPLAVGNEGRSRTNSRSDLRMPSSVVMVNSINGLSSTNNSSYDLTIDTTVLSTDSQLSRGLSVGSTGTACSSHHNFHLFNSVVEIQYLRHYVISRFKTITLHVAHGPLRIRDWPCNQSQTSKLSKPKSGYGILTRLATAFGEFVLSVQIVQTRRAFHNKAMALHWNLEFHSIVSRNSIGMRLVLEGNVAGLKQLLLEKKARISDVLEDGRGLLHCAVKTQNMEMISFLLKNGVEINCTDNDGETPLHLQLSCVHDSADTSEISMMLISCGADPMIHSASGATPLHNFHTPAIESVLKYHSDHVDLETVDDQGMTFFHYLAWSSKSSVGVAQLYLEGVAGAGLLSARDYLGRIPLHLAAQRGNIPLVSYILKIMLSKDMDIMQRDLSGKTAMHYAVESKRVDTIGLLAENGLSIHTTDSLSRTPLHYAAIKCRVDALQKLMDLGAANLLCAVDTIGKTPLDLAKSSTGVSQIIVDLLTIQVDANQEPPKLQAMASEVIEEEDDLQRVDDVGSGWAVARFSLAKLHEKWPFDRLATSLFFAMLSVLLWNCLYLLQPVTFITTT